MSLYYVQKLLYQLNRDPELQQQYLEDPDTVLKHYRLDAEELATLKKPDIGMLYIMGVNGQLLMHYAALCGYAWPDYIQAMRTALEEHGNVRAGLYATTDGKGAI